MEQIEKLRLFRYVGKREIRGQMYLEIGMEEESIGCRIKVIEIIKIMKVLCGGSSDLVNEYDTWFNDMIDSEWYKETKNKIYKECPWMKGVKNVQENCS